MTNDDNQNRSPELQQRITALMRANEQAVRKAIPQEELDELKSAASRLDQILQAAGDSEQQVLKNAAARLDQMLANIRAGKDPVLVRSRSRESPNDAGH